MELRALDVAGILVAAAMYVYLLREHFFERRERLRSVRSARVLVIPIVVTIAAVLTHNWMPAPVIVGIAIWSLRKPLIEKPPGLAR